MNTTDIRYLVVNTSPYTVPANSCDMAIITDGASVVNFPPVIKQNTVIKVINQQEDPVTLNYQGKNPALQGFTLDPDRFVDIIPFPLAGYYLVIGQGSSGQISAAVLPEVVYLEYNLVAGTSGSGTFPMIGYTVSPNFSTFFLRSTTTDGFKIKNPEPGENVLITMEVYPISGRTAGGVIYVTSGITYSVAATSPYSENPGGSTNNFITFQYLLKDFGNNTFAFGSLVRADVQKVRITLDMVNSSTDSLIPVPP